MRRKTNTDAQLHPHAQVLETIDFTRVYVYVAAVEADDTNPEKDQKVRDLMKAAGFYHHGKEMANDWFVNTRPPPVPGVEVGLAGWAAGTAGEGAAAGGAAGATAGAGGRRRGGRR